ncbi:MAG TPA: flagellar brake protein [Rhodocyclaceae bacterium]|nr:flagellar brake protein [Rhodocyclaceae bacterium]
MSETEAAEEPQNALFEFDQVDVYGKYMLHSRAEILFVLRSMEKKNAMTTVYFEHGNFFFLTTILQVDDTGGKIILDYGSDEEINRKALSADRLICTASLDRVKVQFSLRGLTLVKHENRNAFSAAIPGSMLRLQRREYFRLETPHANPIICRAQAQREDGSSFALNLPLLDISGGGVGLMVPLDAEPYCAVGTVFSNCRMDIPEEGVLQVNLVVRSAFRVKARNGHEHLRIGCEFMNLPGNRMNMIQRYITKVERDRKTKMAGWE